MKNSGAKIKFNYLYRDSGNFKIFGSELFNNYNNLDILEVEKRILLRLIDSEFFYPDELGIAKFSLNNFDFNNSWFEFESVENESMLTSSSEFIKLRNIEELFERK